HKATELAPDDPRVWNGLLTYHYRIGDRTGISAMLAKLEGNSRLDAAQKNLLLGQAHAALGNLDEAKRSFVEAANKAQNDIGAQLRVAQFFMQNDPQRAKGHLETALRLDPKSVAAKRMLA